MYRKFNLIARGVSLLVPNWSVREPWILPTTVNSMFSGCTGSIQRLLHPETPADFKKAECDLLLGLIMTQQKNFENMDIFRRCWGDHLECLRWLYMCKHNAWHKLWRFRYHQDENQTVWTVHRGSKSREIDMVDIVNPKTKTLEIRVLRVFLACSALRGCLVGPVSNRLNNTGILCPIKLKWVRIWSIFSISKEKIEKS